MKSLTRSIVLFFAVFLFNPAGSHGAPQTDAVVRVHATIPEHARTAGSLGTTREGNGIVIDRNGHVLTIGYLILEAATLQVTTPDGREMPARFVGYDHDTGFGILQTVPPLAATPLEMGDSSSIAVGDTLQIVSAGDRKSMPTRVLSKEAFVGYWEYLLENSIYVSPPHPDYGGAALLSEDGRLIGVGSILTRIEFESMGWVPCNMFVPIDLLKPILDDLITRGEVQKPARPWIGIYTGEVQGRVVVVQVSEQGPSAEAGIRPGDIILSIDGKPVEGIADLYRKIWGVGSAGVKVPVQVLKGSQVEEVVVQSIDRRQYLIPASKGIGESI